MFSPRVPPRSKAVPSPFPYQCLCQGRFHTVTHGFPLPYHLESGIIGTWTVPRTDTSFPGPRRTEPATPRDLGWTNLGLIVAVEGAELLKASGLGGLPLMFGFVVTAAFANLFMGSASAKWAVMAPVFVPMFMLVGYTPELTQAAYRIGDSVSNVVSTMMSYFALIVAFVERCDKKAGIGTVIATMLPYRVAFLICWSLLMLGWMAIGLPVGPGAGLRLAPAM